MAFAKYTVGDKYKKNSDGTIWTIKTWGDVSVALSNGHSEEYPSHENFRNSYTKIK